MALIGESAGKERHATNFAVFHRGCWRLLVGASLATLALAWASPAGALGFGAGDPSVTIGLQAIHSNSLRPTLDLRGHSIDREDSEAFSVDTLLSRVPCPGEYRFEAAEEDSGNGNSSTYNALIRLAGPTAHPDGGRCGGALPPVRGQMSVLLQDRVDRLFVVKGTRSNGGAFGGRLTLTSLPQCDRNYTLEANVDLAGWSRSLEFRVQVLEVNATLQGKSIESERC